MTVRYWQSVFEHWGMPFDTNWIVPFGVAVFLLVIIWSLVWKGMALWKAAREGNKIWFVIILVVNTLGILEILYLTVFSKKKEPPDM